MEKNSKRFSSFDAIPELTTKQLLLFWEVCEAKSQIEVADRYQDWNQSTVNRAVADLKKKLKLGYLSDKEFWGSKEAESLMSALRPIRDLMIKFERSEFSQVVSVGSGGSLLAWLLGSRIETLREKIGADMPKTIGRQLGNVRFNCISLTNRQTLDSVVNGVLDFGLVRHSVLAHSKAVNLTNSMVQSLPLGNVAYGIAVPDSLKKAWSEWGTDWSVDPTGYLKEEKSILDSGYFVSVGPEGEFKEMLYRALGDAGIDLKIEFSYRSFPHILPHLQYGTHFGLCPMIGDWEVGIPGVQIYPLKLLSDYKRPVSLIWNEKVKKKWLDMNVVGDCLKWTDEPDSKRKGKAKGAGHKR